jgi:hypothetical protein
MFFALNKKQTFATQVLQNSKKPNAKDIVAVINENWLGFSAREF